MKIKIKGIYHERTEDAPFIGALICANDCKFNCKNCINEELKYSNGYYMEDIKIINEVLFNSFNKGIILAGL
jgi:pyruvate-formate lyase-activating enzyme